MPDRRVPRHRECPSDAQIIGSAGSLRSKLSSIITFQLETAISGFPASINTRSVSRYGLSQSGRFLTMAPDVYRAPTVSERNSVVNNGSCRSITTQPGPIRNRDWAKLYVHPCRHGRGANEGEWNPWTPNGLADV